MIKYLNIKELCSISYIKFVVLIFSILSLALSQPLSVLAIKDEGFYSRNDILFYDPDANCSTGNTNMGDSSLTGYGSVGKYKNPVYKGSAPDPSVIYGNDGKFYVYATGGTLLVSDDMSSWKKIDNNWKLKGAPNEAGGKRWAPDIAKVGDKYILTYTIPTGAPEAGGSGKPKIAYAIGDSPGGKFQYKGKLDLHSSFDIDSHIFVDSDDKVWLFWGGGSINVVQLSFNGDRLETKGPEKKLLTKGGVGSSATIEGAYVIKRNGWYYLTYSQGSWDVKNRPPYRVLVARSKTVDGEYKPNNSMKPILEGKAPIIYPGHHSIITDSASNDWIVYHGFYKGSRTRSLNIDPITYSNDGWPVVNENNTPSSTDHPGSATTNPVTVNNSNNSNSNPANPGTQSNQSVFVTGDSLTVGMKNKGNLSDKLKSSGYNLSSVVAKGGENIEWAINQLNKEDVKKSIKNSSYMVIGFGTNHDSNPDAKIDTFIKKIRDINPDISINWINVFTLRKNGYRTNFNNILNAKSSSLGFNIIDWYGEVKDKTDFYQFDSGGIHHTDIGYKRKVEFVANNIKTSSISPGSVSNINTEPIDESLDSDGIQSCCSQQNAGSPVDVNLAGNDNGQKIFNFLTGKDENRAVIKTNNNQPLNAIQAAAFVGNFYQESGLDPKSINSIGATGIAQWLGGRKASLMKKNNPLSLETQLKFVIEELDGGERRIISEPSFKNAKSASDIEAATIAVRKVYERPGENEANDRNRIEYAKKLLNSGGVDTEPTSSAAPTGDCSSDTSSSELGPGSGNFVDTGEIENWNIVSENAILTDKEFGDSMVNSGKCAAIVSRVYRGVNFGNWNNKKYNTTNAYAVSMWYQYYKTDKAHKDRNTPKGAWLFYEHKNTSSTDAGHIVMYLGNNKILNDGKIMNADYIEKEWSLKYLGWIDPASVGLVAKKQSASQLHASMDGYRK